MFPMVFPQSSRSPFQEAEDPLVARVRRAGVPLRGLFGGASGRVKPWLPEVAW